MEVPRTWVAEEDMEGPLAWVAAEDMEGPLTWVAGEDMEAPRWAAAGDMEASLAWAANPPSEAKSLSRRVIAADSFQVNRKVVVVAAAARVVLPAPVAGILFFNSRFNPFATSLGPAGVSGITSLARDATFPSRTSLLQLI